MKKTDAQLIADYLGGNENSLEILIGRYLKPIYSFIYRYVGNLQEAEDVTQDVFVKAWKNLKKFDQSKSFKTWIFSIAKNASIDWLKKKKTVPFFNFENEKGENAVAETLADPAPLSSELFERADIAQVLNSAIEKLSPKYKDVLFLRYNDHFTPLESPAMYGEDNINKSSIPYRKGEVKAPSFLTGFTFREIAQSLGEPLHTIKSRHRRALIVLKKEILNASISV